MDTWYEAELLTDDGSHSLVIASYWMAPSQPSVPPPASPRPTPSMAWARGWLLGAAGMGERMVELGVVSHEPTEPRGARHWTFDDLETLLTTMLLGPEHLAPLLADEPSVAADVLRGMMDGMSGPAADEPVRELVHAAVWDPYVAREQSPPSFDSLVNLAGVGGGLGLGILVAAGALAPIALLTVPGGLVAYALGQGLKRRVRELVDPRRRAFAEIRDLERSGILTKEQADRLIDEEIASRTR